ncbi:MAG: hypothetical protein PHN84_01205 [Desulfuromonadaceae bacterium]|nr:hypothetical protein [Desulfuromonadaceae bacterium]MDD2855281.1 hypothetical protein [Desulfuromonadaceae bacterium]
MPITLETSEKQSFISIRGVTEPDEGDELLSLLREHPGISVDLSGMEHLHTALLQMLISAETPIAAWPQDTFWRKCMTKNPPALPLPEETP